MTVHNLDGSAVPPRSARIPGRRAQTRVQTLCLTDASRADG